MSVIDDLICEQSDEITRLTKDLAYYKRLSDAALKVKKELEDYFYNHPKREEYYAAEDELQSIIKEREK
jgi:hypothetical protein